MKFTSEAYIIGMGLLVMNILFVARLIAAKKGLDPIVNRYKTNSPERKAVKEFIASRKFTVMLSISSLTLPLLALFVAFDTNRLIRSGTATAHYLLVFGPIAAIAIVIVALAVAYGMLVKD